MTAALLSRFAICATAIVMVAGGCGGQEAPGATCADAFGGSDAGVISAEGVTVRPKSSTAFMIGGDASAGTYIGVSLSEADDACQDSLRASQARRFAMVLSVDDLQTIPARLVLGKGIAASVVDDSSTGRSALATGGTISINGYRAGAQIAGAYEVTFSSGERVSGTFATSFCDASRPCGTRL